MRRNIILLVLLFLLGACSPVSEFKENTPVVDLVAETSTSVSTTQTPVPAPSLTPTAESVQCLGNFEEFAYTVVDDYYDYPDLGTVYPLPPWEFVTELQHDEGTPLFSGLSLAVIYENRSEIWISNYYDHDGKEDYIIFYPETKQQITIPSEVGNSGFWVDHLSIDENGTIWGRNNWSEHGEYELESIPIFSKFNRETMRFEFDMNAMHIPVVLNDWEYENWVSYKQGDNEIIWFFVPYDGLYSYNPVSGESIKQLDIPDVKVSNVTLAADGNFYYFVWPDWESEYRTLYKYSPGTNEATIFAEVEHASFSGLGIVMDNQSQLWLGSVSTVDIFGNQVIRHTDYEAYKEKRYSPKNLYWLAPGIMSGSSNGYLWFYKSRYIDQGTAWYDPNTGEGCWFTTFAKGVLEDQDQQVWFLAGNKLYKYSLVE